MGKRESRPGRGGMWKWATPPLQRKWGEAAGAQPMVQGAEKGEEHQRRRKSGTVLMGVLEMGGVGAREEVAWS